MCGRVDIDGADPSFDRSHHSDHHLRKSEFFKLRFLYYLNMSDSLKRPASGDQGPEPEGMSLADAKAAVMKYKRTAKTKRAKFGQS